MMISSSSRKMLYLAVFCVAGVLAAIPGFMMKSQESNISSVKSALLNTKYVKDVNEITLSFPSNFSNGRNSMDSTFQGGKRTFSFRKATTLQGFESWSCTTSDGMSFPVNATIISQLLDRASQTRSMAEVSDSYTAWSALGLSDDSAINMQFSSNSLNSGRKNFSSLFFGYENADGTMIYVRNDRKSSSWRIQNDLSSYLSDSISAWADKHILPVGSPNETDARISLITIETPEGTKKIYNTDGTGTRFDDAVHTLLSLRSSEFLSCDDLDFQQTVSERIMTVTLDTSASSQGYPYGFHVFRIMYDEEPVFFVQNFGISGSAEAAYLQVISTWTFNRICEVLSE